MLHGPALQKIVRGFLCPLPHEVGSTEAQDHLGQKPKGKDPQLTTRTGEHVGAWAACVGLKGQSPSGRGWKQMPPPLSVPAGDSLESVWPTQQETEVDRAEGCFLNNWERRLLSARTLSLKSSEKERTGKMDADGRGTRCHGVYVAKEHRTKT